MFLVILLLRSLPASVLSARGDDLLVGLEDAGEPVDEPGGRPPEPVVECSRGTRTVQSKCRRTATAVAPTRGKKVSARRVMNSPTCKGTAF